MINYYDKRMETAIMQKKAGYTIGVLVDFIGSPFHHTLATGIQEEAEKNGLNLIYFCGGTLKPFNEYQVSFNLSFDLVKKDFIDYIIVFPGIFNNAASKQIREFLARFASIPLVIIGMEYEDYPCVVVDNASGYRELIAHIIEKHGRKNIAFIKGLEGTYDSEMRFTAFKSTLTAHGMTFREDLVFPGNYTMQSGRDAVNAMMDERQFKPSIDFDAIIAVNDAGAIGAIEALSERGVKLPEQVSVGGFDNWSLGKSIITPLSTVTQDIKKLGREAVQTCIRKNDKRKNEIPTELVIRKSCGCNKTKRDYSQRPESEEIRDAIRKKLAEDRKELSERIKKIIDFPYRGVYLEKTVYRLIDSILLLFRDEGGEAFFGEFYSILSAISADDVDIESWDTAFNLLKEWLETATSSGSLSFGTRDMLNEASTTLMLKIIESGIRYHPKYFDNDYDVRDSEIKLHQSLDMEQFLDRLSHILPALGFGSYYLFLFDNPGDYEHDFTLISACTNKIRVELDDENRRYPDFGAIVTRLITGDFVFSYCILPVTHREVKLGFLILTTQLKYSARTIYDSISLTIGGTLNSIMLMTQVREANNFIESVIGSMTDAFAVVDTGGRVIKVNEAFTRLFADKYGAAGDPRILGSDIADFLPISDIFGESSPRQYVVREPIENMEIGERQGKKACVPLSLSAAPIHSAKGETVGTVIILRDISLQKETEKNLKFIALHDLLTDLPNRVLLHDRIVQAISRANRNNTVVAIFLLDLDRFKEVNDTMGHGAGDLLLKEIAIRLKGCIREYDTVGRLGGDEFVLIVTDMKEKYDITVVANRILKAFEAPISVENKKIHITTSIGISLFPNDGDNIEILLKNADIAMYSAKKLDGNRFCFFEASMGKSSEEQVFIKNGLIHALEKNEFTLYYQPLVDVETGAILAAEALIRWIHPELGFVEPLSFITVAEKTGLILQIGEWVLRTACAQCKAWEKETRGSISVSVNISARQLYDIRLRDKIIETLRACGLAPECLILEITESSAMKNIKNAIEIIGELSRYGVRIVLDDFGSGYSSFNWLKMLPVNAVKIDKFFVQNVVGDPFDAAIVRAIISMAHSLNLKVIAEGVENTEQLEFLRSIKYPMNDSLKCDQVQGYLFGKPIPADDFSLLLKSRINGAQSNPGRGE